MTGRTPTIWLEMDAGRPSPHRLPMGSAVVGRNADADLSIASEYVSGHHAELYWDGERLRVRDLGSRNGTRVNDEPVVDWIDLRDGDVVRFGTIEGVIEVDVEPAPPRSPEASRGPQAGSATRLSQVPIFISHSSEDKRAARTLARYLRSRGWTVWIDEAGIEGGKDWRSELIQALEGTWVVLLLVSYRSMQSKWVIREVQAADRLGLQIIPVLVDNAPYPDPLRMILGGVQQIDATGIHDNDRRNQQLDRLDVALIHAAQNIGRTRPGKVQIVVGTIVAVIGLVAFLVGFGLFAFLGFQEVNSGPSFGGGIPRPFLAFPAAFVGIILAGIGQAIRRAGMKKGI